MVAHTENRKLAGYAKTEYLDWCERANLEYLLVYKKFKSPCTPFRTFLDNWYAYHKRGPFLNRNLKPHWFNKPDPVKHREALLNMEFISKSARRVIENGQPEHLVKDHSIPVIRLKECFLKRDLSSVAAIRQFLIDRYRLGVVTKEEDRILDSRKLRSKMPENWDGIDPYARYREVGIE